MIVFDEIMIDGTPLQMRELRFGEALHLTSIKDISTFDPDLGKKITYVQDEKRLTRFLSYVLDEQLVDVRLLTVQERYYFLLKYLQQNISELLKSDVSYAQYIPTFSPHDNIVVVNELTRESESVRALNGYDLELLELNCITPEEWFSSVFVATYSNQDIAELSEPLDFTADDYAENFKQRLMYLNQLPVSEYDVLFARYLELNDLLEAENAQGLNMKIVFGQRGVELRQGGVDDESQRFCCDVALGLILKC